MMHYLLWNEGWTAAIINHLWQSILFVLIAWTVTLLLRNNRARTRYWIWMTASIKFLVPFSLLIDAGEYLQTLFAAQAHNAALTTALEQAVQPFFRASPVESSIYQNAPIAAATAVNPLTVLLPAIWLCGFLASMVLWTCSWMRIRKAVRSSTKAGILKNVWILISDQLLEPAVFGIVRPVLLLPRAIKNRLSEPQFNSIIAHEMFHIVRRDNLYTAVHMFVQSVFWFHPAVWWIKVRLIDERERACDEAVLQSGAEAALYAESILKVCRFCVESPLPCASGVSGSDLK